MASQENQPKSSENPQPESVGAALEADRRVKLKRLREEFNVDPFGKRVDGLITLEAARSTYNKEADEAAKADAANDRRAIVKVSGRVMLHRDSGKLIFVKLRDATGDLQIAVSKNAVDEQSFKLAKIVDLGDIAVASGRIGTTKTGEITVWVAGDGGFSIATKSLATPPEKYHGLADPELRYRKRYIDLYANPEVTQTFMLRSRIVKGVRDFLTNPPAELGAGFLEVETPMMQPIPGGAAARPFITHHNALDIDLYLRIAPELYLKRLLVGGLPRVFEINRNFRNEGIDRSHNPEFTMLELYQAFGDYNAMMQLTETLFNHLARTLCGGETLPYGDFQINYAVPFRRAKYHDLFREHAGFDPADHAKLKELARKHHIEDIEKKDHDLLLNEVWEEVVEQHLVQPTFVIDYPASLCPLTKRKPENPAIAERFELFIANMELANAYTELNDPDVQLENFQQQLAGEDDEAATFRNLDMDFVEALKVGMPPAGGLGIGIDRLIMLLTNHRTIRDVILFPLMRPQG
jgi:lysyl-tRNA synthetase class 2